MSYNYVFGYIKLPLCQCECCPGYQCSSQLLVFSVDICNETTCSFDQCYDMYPKKCGLIPGITNTFCNVMNHTTINSTRIPIPRLPNTASSNMIFPMMMIFCLLLNY